MNFAIVSNLNGIGLQVEAARVGSFFQKACDLRRCDNHARHRHHRADDGLVIGGLSGIDWRQLGRPSREVQPMQRPRRTQRHRIG